MEAELGLIGEYLAVHMVHILSVLVQVCVESSLRLKAADPLVLIELSLAKIRKICLQYKDFHVFLRVILMKMFR